MSYSPLPSTRIAQSVHTPPYLTPLTKYQTDEFFYGTSDHHSESVHVPLTTITSASSPRYRSSRTDNIVYTRRAGGKGVNQAKVVARAGETVNLVGAVGEDGAWLIRNLEAYGVSTANISVVQVRYDQFSS